MPQDPNARQTVQLPFTGGIDQRTEPEYLDPSARVLDVINGGWLKDGGVRKRFGVGSLANAQFPGDPAMQPPLRLVTRGAELARIDGDSLFSFSPAAGMWSQRSLMPASAATRQHLATATGWLISFTESEGNGFRAVTYRNQPGGTGDVFTSVYDLATGEAVFLNFKVSTGQQYRSPVCHIVGTNLYVFYMWANGANDNIVARVLNLTTMTWGVQTNVVTDALLNANFYDVTPYVGGTGLLLFYVQDGGSGVQNARAARLEALPALTVSASFNVQTIATDGTISYAAMCCRHDAATTNRAWFFWEQFGGGAYTFDEAAYDATAWTAIGAPPYPVTYTGYLAALRVPALGIEILSATQALFTFCIPQTGTNPSVAHAVYTSTGGAIAARSYPLGEFISRPFLATINGTTRCYVIFAMFEQIVPGGPYYTTYYLMDTRAYDAGGFPRVVATLAPRQGNSAYVQNAQFTDGRPVYGSNIGLPNAGSFSFPVIVNPSEEFANQSVSTIAALFVDILTFDFTGATTWQVAEGDNETFLSGGVPSFYDGNGVQECSFFSWPTPVGNPVVSTTGGSLGTGQYGYAFIWAQVDDAGRIHRSAAYTANITTTAATSSMTWTFNNLPYTARYPSRQAPVLEMYRTAVNGTIYYYVATLATNGLGGGAIGILDTASDASINTNALLYTTGGVLDSICPPSARAMWRHQARIWMIDDTGYVLWYTTAFNGADAPYFNEGLTYIVYDGPLTAGIALDDKNFIFSATHIWMFTGDGPPLTGQGSDLSSLISIPSDVGAADWRSVVVFPGGILFQAPSSGVYQLGRDLAVTFIGKAVQDLTAGKSVVGAQLVASQNQVRFLLSDGSSLSYDYVFGRWSRNSYAYPLTCSASTGAGAWVAGASDGFVYQDKTAASTKPWYDTKSGVHTWITSSVTTGDVKTLGLQGWLELGPVQGLAPWLDPCDVTMTLTFDHGRATQAHTYAHAALVAANSLEAQWQLWPQAANAIAESVRITVSDAPASDATSATGQGVRWLGVAVDVAPIGPRNLNLSASVKA